MSGTRSRKNKEVVQDESSFQNVETSSSIPPKTRVQGNNGEPIHHGHEESSGEIPQREGSSLGSLVVDLYIKCMESSQR